MRARLPDDAPLIFKVLLGLGVGVIMAFTLGTAGADCAWVLWAQISYTAHGIVDPWQVVSAYETKAECDRQTQLPHDVRITKWEGNHQVRWACLPDTVKP